ncbi:transcription termination/antitermination protein NusA [Endomicrobiia bacterium]|uniref:transcription termination factor NusA n=1 Tax=Endomicrobium trichonymphae TaxID=1408204 RepID=UPI0022195429|nr:transcription termination/antitermination protein NusA [Endomicrobiia bacterium]GMO52075.1 MAG: transcription termination factor NusA [Candidatus Endomicrobium trichonymphae]GHT08966.1 transcription termination/antitermination protein NusA [Endomicrobiia bacterium]GHT12671.1 transcription termination/antitermination protein NusA [Endomicrobiia bacterium]GHT21082.1 transcription termination/antitermination protein NusA [Endomicrobiia bacterium]
MAEKGELLIALEQIEKDKKIKKEDILVVIENALVSAYKKHVGKNVNVEAKVNPELGEMTASVVKVVVKDVVNPLLEICVQDAKKFDQSAEIGTEVRIPLDTRDFSRIAAQTAKQVIVQKIRESERDSLFDEMKEKIGQIANGAIYRIINRNLIVDLGKTEAILPSSEQVFKEKFSVGQYIKAVIIKVEKSVKGSGVVLSRTSIELVKRLFELEVPEIYEKIVEIVNVVREPGVRTKITVLSHNPKVDPVGACVGVKGARVKPIIDELRGERIDLVSYSVDPAKYIASAMSPAKIVSVTTISEEEKKAEVLVTDDMLFLAIGKNGHNVRLAAKLTGWHIDVKSEGQKKQEGNERIEKQAEVFEKLEGFSERIIKMLVKAGITDVEKLSLLTTEYLITLPGIGHKTAEKIIEVAKNSIRK